MDITISKERLDRTTTFQDLGFRVSEKSASHTLHIDQSIPLKKEYTGNAQLQALLTVLQAKETDEQGLLLRLVLPYKKKRFRRDHSFEIEKYAQKRDDILDRKWADLEHIEMRARQSNLSTEDTKHESNKQIQLYAEEISALNESIAEEFKKETAQMMVQSWGKLPLLERKKVIIAMLEPLGNQPKSKQERWGFLRRRNEKGQFKDLLSRASGRQLQKFIDTILPVQKSSKTHTR